MSVWAQSAYGNPIPVQVQQDNPYNGNLIQPVIPHWEGNEHEKPNKGHAALKILAEHIAQQLKERGFCVVFECDLERCWPSSGMSRAERERKIQEFAESQGWTVAILDAGSATRAIFQEEYALHKR